MRIVSIAGVVLALCFAGFAAQAQTAISASCKDGSTQTGASRRAACKGHGGVIPAKASTAATPGNAASPPTDTAAPGASATPAEQPAATPATPPAAKPRNARGPATPVVARIPNNPTDVWVNSSTKIYHCPGSRPYGKTKAGSFMTEVAAKAAGDRASHNKACTGGAAPISPATKE